MGAKQTGVLKVALVDGPGRALADWQAMVIDRLRADPRFELVGRIDGGSARGDAPLSLAARALLSGEMALIRKRILPYDTRLASAALADLPVLQGGVAGEPVADIALALGPTSLSDGQLALARDGEWGLSFAGAADPSWICMAVAVRQAPLVGVEILTRRAECPQPHVLRRTGYNPKPGAGLTGAFVAEKSVLFLMRALADLAAGRAETDGDLIPAARPEMPGMGSVLSYGRSFAASAVRKLTENARARRGRGRDFWRLAGGSGDITGFAPDRTIDIPRHAFLMADPFLFEHEGAMWLFYEAMQTDTGRAWIEAALLEGDQLREPVTVLKCDYHLSYPFVFRDGDAIYMMPETQQSQRLEIWRATGFPSRWKLHATAFEGQFLADSSLFKDDSGQWWLLTNLSDHHAFQDHSGELYLFSVDGPDLRRITPHPRNPVAIGSGHARNAGSVIRHQGRLFRPSQNNSYGVYGYGLNLMEILRLDENDYEERLLRQFTPADRPGCTAMHHLSCAGGRYVIDLGGHEEPRK